MNNKIFTNIRSNVFVKYHCHMGLDARCLLSKLATREISFFYLVFVAEQTVLGMTWSEIQKTGFLGTRLR